MDNKLNCAEMFYENQSFQIQCLFCGKVFGVEFDQVIEHLEKHLEIEDLTTNSLPQIDEIIFEDVRIEAIEEQIDHKNNSDSFGFTNDPILSPETECRKEHISKRNNTSCSPEANYIVSAAKLSETDNLYHCPYAGCNQKDESKELVQMHVIIRHVLNPRNCTEKGMFQCYICDRKLSNRKSFIKHLKSVHQVITSVNINPSNDDGKYYCPLCEDKYFELKYLNQHLRFKHEDYFFYLLKNQQKEISNEENAEDFIENDLKKQVDDEDMLITDNLSGESDEKKETTEPIKKKIKCDICRKHFSRKNALVRHLLNIHKISLYKCKCIRCKKKNCKCTIPKDHDNLQNNSETVESKNFEPDSELEFKEEVEDEELMKEITSNGVYAESLELSNNLLKLETELFNVPKDANEVSSNILLNEPVHVPIVQSSKVDNLFYCPFQNCNQAVESENLIIIHMITIHILDFCNDNDTFECPRCPAELNSKNSFIRHLQFYHGILIEKFEPNLERNKGTDNGEPNGESRVRKRERKYRDSSRKPRNKKRNEFHCDICGIAVLTQKRLYYHKLTHKERAFQCEYCNKKFIFHINLVAHTEIHIGEKKYKCEYCDNAFLRSTDRTSHVNRVHLKTKKNQCELCGKGFYTPSELINHNRRHTGEKKFKCDICNKCYYDSSHLKTHMDSHSTIKGKRFPCELCNSKFSSTKSLRAHKAIHSNEKKYHCVICNQSFKQNAGLYSHNKTHHQHIIEENRLLKLKANDL